PDVGADGGAQDGAELALGDRAVRRERLEDVPDVPDERAVARVVTVRGDEVAEAAVGRVDVLHARVDPADDDGLARVGALAGLRLLGLDDGEGHRAVGGVAGGVGGPVVDGVLAGLGHGDGTGVGGPVAAVEGVLDGGDAGVGVGGG